MHYLEIGEASDLGVQEAVFAALYEDEAPTMSYVARFLAEGYGISDGEARDRINEALAAGEVVAHLSDDAEPVWHLALDPLVLCQIRRRYEAYVAIKEQERTA